MDYFFNVALVMFRCEWLGLGKSCDMLVVICGRSMV
jgi:hypothetical protein